MNRSTQYVQILLKFLLPTYIVAILLLTIFRIIFIYHLHETLIGIYSTSNEQLTIIRKAMGKGFRFDNIVISTTYILPLFFLIILWITNRPIKLYLKLCAIYLGIASAVIFGFSCIDFPYYEYFGTHPNRSITNWLAYSSTYEMILNESSYYIYFILYIVTVAISVMSIRFCYKRTKNYREIRNNSASSNSWVQSCLFILFSLLIWLGYRGNLKHPINEYNARFSMFSFINDIPLTPIYHFYVSCRSNNTGEQYLINSDKALANVKRYLGIETNEKYKNPLTRYVEADSLRETTKPNIVVIFMESMSVDLLGKEENNIKLTPFLDSLIENSYYFENFYSAGTHTNHGVASVITGYPSVFDSHMTSPPHNYKGIASTLKEIGYKTSFFISHDKEFDSMGNFLDACEFDIVYDKKYYEGATSDVFGGVPDNLLFNHALDKINNFDSDPFLSMILTISNHPPFVSPDKYKKISNNHQIAVIAYADDALKDFMQKASEHKWYDNTIFILVGDHGKLTPGNKYNMPLSLNHVPCIMYSPLFENMPQRFPQFGSQIDIYPTIMGMINQPYYNNSLGVDLFKETRPCMFFTSDTRLGCINDSLFYVYSPLDKHEDLYDLQSEENVISSRQEQAREMKEYSTSMLTVARDLYRSGLSKEY